MLLRCVTTESHRNISMKLDCCMDHANAMYPATLLTQSDRLLSFDTLSDGRFFGDVRERGFVASVILRGVSPADSISFGFVDPCRRCTDSPSAVHTHYNAWHTRSDIVRIEGN